jgi:hypothetical protein
MLSLDSDSVVRELEQRHPGQQWELGARGERRRGAALQQHAQRTVQRQRQRASRRCNELYSFKLTSGQREVRLHGCGSVIDEHGHWAASTAQHCHYDGQPFAGPPAAVPWRCDRGVWQTQGCFCSWSCARAWLERQALRDGERQHRLELLQELARRYFGLAVVHRALPLEALRIYGGYLELDEWREAARSKSSTLLYEPPLEPLDMLVLERLNDWELRRQRHEFYHGRTAEERRQKEHERQHKLEHDLKAAAEREAQRLRRQASSKNTLFQTMGIQLID